MERGVFGIAGFLSISSEMRILWSPPYLSRVSVGLPCALIWAVLLLWALQARVCGCCQRFRVIS